MDVEKLGDAVEPSKVSWSAAREKRDSSRFDLAEIFEGRSTGENPARSSANRVNSGELSSLGVGKLVDDDTVEAVNLREDQQARQGTAR